MVKKRYLLIPALLVSFASAEIKNLSEAIDTSGKQRMLSQLMLKDMAMVKSENFYDNPYEDFDTALEEFSTNLDELIEFNTDDNTEKSLLELKKEWDSIQSLFEEDEDEDEDEESEDEESEESEDEAEEEEKPEIKATKEENISSIIEMEKKLSGILILADKSTKAFLAQDSSKSKNIINIAGKQRMLSQRMAALYLMKSLGATNDELNKKLNDSLDSFQNGLNEMKKYSKNTENTKKLIKKTEKSFMFFVMMNKTSNKFIPTLIYKKSKTMLSNMDSVTKEYIKIEGGK